MAKREGHAVPSCKGSRPTVGNHEEIFSAARSMHENVDDLLIARLHTKHPPTHAWRCCVSAKLTRQGGNLCANLGDTRSACTISSTGAAHPLLVKRRLPCSLLPERLRIRLGFCLHHGLWRRSI